MSEDRMRVTFLNLSKDSQSPVIATIGFYIFSMDMYLSKVKLVKKKDGGFYLAPPSEKYQDPKTGKEAYGNFFWFGEKSSEFFQKQALQALSTYCQTKGIPDPTKTQQTPKESVLEPIRSLEPFKSMDQKAKSDETQPTFKTLSSFLQ